MAGPNTVIGDAIGLAIRTFEASEIEQRLLILLSDGADTGSRMGPVNAAEIATQNGVSIFTIGVGDPTGSGEERVDLDGLARYCQPCSRPVLLRRRRGRARQRLCRDRRHDAACGRGAQPPPARTAGPSGVGGRGLAGPGVDRLAASFGAQWAGRGRDGVSRPRGFLPLHPTLVVGPGAAGVSALVADSHTRHGPAGPTRRHRTASRRGADGGRWGCAAGVADRRGRWRRSSCLRSGLPGRPGAGCRARWWQRPHRWRSRSR